MKNLCIEELVEWSESESGGVITGFSHENFKTVTYFMREFAVPMENPWDELGAFRLGKMLIVGRRWFLADVSKGLGLPG